MLLPALTFPGGSFAVPKRRVTVHIATQGCAVVRSEQHQRVVMHVGGTQRRHDLAYGPVNLGYGVTDGPPRCGVAEARPANTVC